MLSAYTLPTRCPLPPYAIPTRCPLSPYALPTHCPVLTDSMFYALSPTRRRTRYGICGTEVGSGAMRCAAASSRVAPGPAIVTASDRNQ
eukprot:613632-Rhodomonas_salina.1